MMTNVELAAALRRIAPETGSLVCLGCGHEHDCGIHGCALLHEAAERILDYAVDFTCPKPDKYQAKCGSVPHAIAIGECRACWERYLAEEDDDAKTD